MSIFEAIKWAEGILDNSDTPRLDAEVIICNVLQRDKMYIYLNRDMKISDVDREKFINFVNRRKMGEPIAYIIGSKEFMGLDFTVGEGVLIPRPDTEVLVENVLDRIKNIVNPMVIDVGCGSGAISVSIACYKKDANVYSLDISDIPLKVTEINAKNNNVHDRIRVIKSDILGSLSNSLGGKVDVIVSNPPYIKKDVIEGLMKDVKDFEPYNALCGGDDGLYFYREITKQSIEFLKQDGILAYEIGYDQGEAVRNILFNNGFKNVVCIKDLAGLDRVIIGEKI